MSDAMPRLQIRNDVDLVAVVPYLIGFQPGDGSIVVLAFAGDLAVFTARIDLPGPDSPTATLLDMSCHLADVARRAHPNPTMALIGYGPAADLDPALHTAATVFSACGLSVRQPLRMTDQRIVHPGCTHPGCPPEGIPFDPSTSPVPAEATYAGVVALPNRAAKTGLPAPDAAASGEAIQQAIVQATARLQQLGDNDAAVDEAAVSAITEALSRHAIGTSPDDTELAWLLVLLARPSVWNRAIDRTEPDPQHLAFWTEITRRAPDPFVPAPATLLAFTAWGCGDGMIAALAAQRALKVDPANEHAIVILSAVNAGISPAEIERSIADLNTASDLEDDHGK